MIFATISLVLCKPSVLKACMLIPISKARKELSDFLEFMLKRGQYTIKMFFMLQPSTIQAKKIFIPDTYKSFFYPCSLICCVRLR